MKFFFIVVVTLSFAGIIWLLFPKPDELIPDESLKESPVITHPDIISTTYKDTVYYVHFTNITGMAISVIPNFTVQDGASTIAEENNCSSAINGGFYTEEDTPLGLFRYDGNQISSETTETNLVKAFFFVNEAGDAFIDWDYPDDAQTVIQSGPFYVSGQTVSTVNDKPARRMVLIESESGDFYSAAITMENLTTSGPYLSDIGTIIFSITEPFAPVAVLNLDGGAASYYLGSDGYELSELTRVGSLICVK